MDHIFEQKLVRENQQLQFELAKLNKQVKQLQETVVGYEQMISQLNLSEGHDRNVRIARSIAKKERAAYEAAEEAKNIRTKISGLPSIEMRKAGFEAAHPHLTGLDATVARGSMEGLSGLRRALRTGVNKVERSRGSRIARSLIAKPGSEAAKQGERAQALGIHHTGSSRLAVHPSVRLANLGMLPQKKFGAPVGEPGSGTRQYAGGQNQAFHKITGMSPNG